MQDFRGYFEIFYGEKKLISIDIFKDPSETRTGGLWSGYQASYPLRHQHLIPSL